MRLRLRVRGSVRGARGGGPACEGDRPRGGEPARVPPRCPRVDDLGVESG